MKTILFTSLLILALPVQAEPQSDSPSQASAISLAPSVEITAASLKLVPAGSRLLVKSLRPLGEVIEVVAVSVATGAGITITIAASTLHAASVVIGSTLLVTAVSTGYLLMAGSEALAFIPDETCRAHIHHRRL